MAISVEDKKGTNWSREETILAFELYFRTPFSKIVKSNPEIKDLAELIGRTPSSVCLKMANLASCDPEIKARNLKGMSNSSKLDRQIFNEFASNWPELTYQAKKLIAEFRQENIENLMECDIDLESIPEGNYRETVIKSRVGQYFFRMSVLAAYGNRCCMTGLSNTDMLIASHIKPWRDSDEKTERTNPANGLCLNPLHDKAFDRGLITVNKNYEIIISNHLYQSGMDEATANWIRHYDKRQIILPDKFLPAKSFIEYHNDVIFQG